MGGSFARVSCYRGVAGLSEHAPIEALSDCPFGSIIRIIAGANSEISVRSGLSFESNLMNLLSLHIARDE